MFKTFLRFFKHPVTATLAQPIVWFWGVAIVFRMSVAQKSLLNTNNV